MRVRRVFLTALGTCLLWGPGCTVNDQPPAHRAPLVTGETVDIDTSYGRVPTLVVGSQTSDRARVVRPALVIGLHGYGIDERQIATLLAIDPAFDHVYMAPRGFYELDDGSRGWFPIEVVDGQPVIDPQELRRCLDRLAEYLSSAAASVRSDRVYVIGYSQGGTVAVAMAMARPAAADAYAAFASSIRPEMHGLTADREALSRTRLLIGHGTLDGFTSVEEMEHAVNGLNQAGLNAELRRYRVPHVVSSAQRRDLTTWLNEHHAGHGSVR